MADKVPFVITRPTKPISQMSEAELRDFATALGEKVRSGIAIATKGDEPPPDKAVRYSEDQARDDHGRFASEGGGATGTPTVRTTPVGIKACMTGAFYNSREWDLSIVNGHSVLADQIAQTVGATGLPDVLPKSEIDKYVAAGETELFRGVTREQYADQLKHGELRMSCGQNGSGIYFSWGEGAEAGAAKYAAGAAHSAYVEDDTKPAESPTVIRATLKEDARVIDWATAVTRARDEGEQWAQERPSADEKNFWRTVSANAGAYALMRGYDAIKWTPYARDDAGSMVVVNRAALRIQGT